MCLLFLDVTLSAMKPFQDIDNASHTPSQMESSGSDWVIVPEPEVKKLADLRSLSTNLPIKFCNL